MWCGKQDAQISNNNLDSKRICVIGAAAAGVVASCYRMRRNFWAHSSSVRTQFAFTTEEKFDQKFKSSCLTSSKIMDQQPDETLGGLWVLDRLQGG